MRTLRFYSSGAQGAALARLSAKRLPSFRDRLMPDLTAQEELLMFKRMTQREGKPAWNRNKLVGQKPPLKLKEIWAIRVRLQMTERWRDLALFNLAIDSKLRACDLVKLRVQDVCHATRVMPRAIILQQKTNRPVQFEITEQTRAAISRWIRDRRASTSIYLFPSRVRATGHLSTRQYSRLLAGWLAAIDLDPGIYGTHSLRRTKASLIYRSTKNLRAVQLLLGHTKLESTVRYLGIEVDDALELAEQTEV